GAGVIVTGVRWHGDRRTTTANGERLASRITDVKDETSRAFASFAQRARTVATERLCGCGNAAGRYNRGDGQAFVQHHDPQPGHRPPTRSTTDMLPIRVVPRRVASRLAGWALAVLLSGSLLGPAGAVPLPINGVEEFRATLVQDRSLSADEASAASALVERRRELREAGRRLPSLGEVTRALLLPDWGSAEFDEFDTPVPLDRIEAAVRQPNDEDFKRD